MKKRMIIMLVCVAILFALIFAYKFISEIMMFKAMAGMSQAITVSTTKAEYTPWQPQLTYTASLRAINGVNVTTELAGMVQKIYFTPGSFVKQGDVLVQLNADSDIAQLHALQANAGLALTVYRRDTAQYAVHAVSKATVDADRANLESRKAEVESQAAIVLKKTIRAPFAGRLGIREINLGQYVNPGNKIVTLQTLNPMYADFAVPQQALINIKTQQVVNMNVDAFPQTVFTGTITTINPIVDDTTRNAQVEATITNPDYKIIPGMFASVIIRTGKPQNFLTLPQTAVSYNPYGDIAYIVKQTGKDKKGKPILTVQQTFVVTGEKRGDQVVILSGIKKGDEVVTSGQLKLKNGSQVVVNNTVVPTNNPAPTVTDE